MSSLYSCSDLTVWERRRSRRALLSRHCGCQGLFGRDQVIRRLGCVCGQMLVGNPKDIARQFVGRITHGKSPRRRKLRPALRLLEWRGYRDNQVGKLAVAAKCEKAETSPCS